MSGYINIVITDSDIESIAEMADVPLALAQERAQSWAKYIEETASELVNEQLHSVIAGDQP